ncbi:MAG: RNA polymerase sigma factor [Planctomycetota bacterium]
MQKQLEKTIIDDAILVRQSQHGDSVAMSRLIIKYQDRIHNAILKICTNSHDAAELTQDTFVKFIEKVNTFEGKSAFYTWLFRIAINLTLNHCRRRAKRQGLSLQSVMAAESDAAAVELGAFLANKSALDPAVVAQDREAGEIALAALEKLADHHRAVVVLRDIEGMDYSQIAETLEIGIGTVKSRLSRARASLREILKAVLK